MSDSCAKYIETIKSEQERSRQIQTMLTFDSGVWLRPMISRHSKLNNGSSWEIQMVKTFHSDIRFRRIIYRDNRNWTWKLLANSNGFNFWLGCMNKAHDISRLSKLNNGSSRVIQMVITFHSDVWFRRIIYWDNQKWTRKFYANSNDVNFWLECMIEAHDIYRRSKLNNGSSRVIQMVITFDSDIRFSHIIYRDTRNWTWKLSANSNSHNFWLGCMIEAHDISGRSK